jgi:ribosomal protein S18 acetylase RimI-like enzyme
VRRELGQGLELDDDRRRIDVAAVHAWLSTESYWAEGRSYEVVERTVRDASRVVGLYDHGRQIGFARVVSDDLTFAYLADVYVLSGYRGRGLGEALMREAVDGGRHAGVSWLLHTLDAHDLYRKLGFGEPGERLMERPRPG